MLPALFLLPTLFLFVFLIFETAKLSRAKIRHQFAVDAAAFVEMTNYSDFLNRSAYVNGAFPMRIFWEGFHDGPGIDCQGRDPCPKPPITRNPAPINEILYADGVYPAAGAGDPGGLTDPNTFDGGQGAWPIRYYHPARPNMDQVEPNVDESCTANGQTYPNCVTIISMDTAKYWNINWEDANAIYSLYVKIYQLLGSVESAQFSVLKRLQGASGGVPHNFLRKSYFLNVGGDNAGAEAAALSDSLDASNPAEWNPGPVHFECASRVLFHGNQLVHSWGQPYQIWASDPPPQMPNTIPDCSGLFQAVWVEPSVIKSLSSVGASPYPGWPAQTRYLVDDDGGKADGSANYFNVPVNAVLGQADGGPRVHATVAIGGFNGANPAVWLENGIGPTPKFQVREYP
ncbi:MAG: hypothetical protein KGJ45_09250 [Elusimicrobia bacterium]|nr:hypothetical protein [Elusimicrobiota bacterium]